MKTLTSDVAIVGGGLGGVAAAIVLSDLGVSVTLTDEFSWIGGQVTSQALCVMDDLHDPIAETIGVTRRCAEFRARVRDWYRKHYELSAFARGQFHFCPGNARCSHLAAEPQVAHEVFLAWLQPAVAAGRLKILTGFVPVSAERKNDLALSVTCVNRASGEQVKIAAKFFLDGTECGDTYPLFGIPYRTGIESRSEFNEAHAPEQADPRGVQAFTYGIVVEFVPGRNFVIPKPMNYEYWRDHQGFWLSSAGATQEEPAYFFMPRIRRDGLRIVPFWNYRSVLDTRNFVKHPGLYERAVINVSSNDFHEEAFLEHTNPEKVLASARELSTAYLYWLQTEAPRDEGGYGYPELRPATECTGTPDGIAQAPYVREGRRLRSPFVVSECDISKASQPEARARLFSDSVGLGGYAIDIHQSAGRPEAGVWQDTRPYQIPLSALVTSELRNFAVAGKGIGVTHITNGAYRLHPEEWAIGEAAGRLAQYALEHGVHAHLSGKDLFSFQRALIRDGTPVYWYEDLDSRAPGFEAAQLLAIRGVWPGQPDHLRFDGHISLCRCREEFLAAVDRLSRAGLAMEEFREPHLNSHGIRKYDLLYSLLNWIDDHGWPKDYLTSGR